MLGMSTFMHAHPKISHPRTGPFTSLKLGARLHRFFTAVAIYQLQDRGLLNVSDAVRHTHLIDLRCSHPSPIS